MADSERKGGGCSDSSVRPNPLLTLGATVIGQLRGFQGESQNVSIYFVRNELDVECYWRRREKIEIITNSCRSGAPAFLLKLHWVELYIM